MSMELATGLAIGVFLGGAGVGIFMGTIAHNNFEKYKSMKRTAFGLEEQLLDCLEGNTDRRWMMVADGAEDPYVVRGRPDTAKVREKRSSALSREEENDAIIDLTWAAGDD